MGDTIIDVLVKLFDTLKLSIDKNENSTQQLIGQQHDLVNHIKNLPLKDLNNDLKEHIRNSKDNIDECTDVILLKISDLIIEITKLSNKVSKMILVVAVAFTILTGSYIVIRSIAEGPSPFNVWQKHEIELQNKMLQDVAKQIDQLREEINIINDNINKKEEDGG